VQAVPVVGAQPPVALAQPAARALVPAVLAEPDQPPVLAIPVVAPQPPTAGAAVVALKVLLDGHCIAQAGCLGTFKQAYWLPDSCGRPVYKNGEHYLFFFGARWLVGPEDALGTGTYALMYAEDAALSPVDITAVWQEIVAGEWAAAPGVAVRDVATVLRAGKPWEAPFHEPATTNNYSPVMCPRSSCSAAVCHGHQKCALPDSAR